MSIKRNENCDWVVCQSDSGLHREDGPSVTRPDGTKEWWVDGKQHREDGPAVERADGSKEWYLSGVSISHYIKERTISYDISWIGAWRTERKNRVCLVINIVEEFASYYVVFSGDPKDDQDMVASGRLPTAMAVLKFISSRCG